MRVCSVEGCDSFVFGTCKISRKGYCKTHQSKREDFDKRSIVQKALSKQQEMKVRALGSTQENKLVANQAAEDIQKLQNWFDTIAKEIDKKPKCWHCSGFIPKKYYRAATAHVIPKRKEYGFPSVSTHPDNYLVLCSGNGCHQRYDRSWEDAAQMSIWNIAVEKFQKIYPSIAKSEKKNIPDILLQELNPDLL